MKHGKTAVYTILKNELKYIDTWLYYADKFDYKVLLDTGSTDGSWEYLQECQSKDPKLIIEQKTFTPWRFDTARKYNMTMVPNDVVWGLSPDLDEFFSINTHDEMERIIDAVPHITNISCDRLDIYSPTVRVGPPNFIGTNKIHRFKDYTWKEPVYEHLTWIHQDREECELYSDDIFLIHNQDFRKKERSDLYVKLMSEEYKNNPTNTWNLWYYLYHLEKSKQLQLYIECGCIFVTHHKKQDEWMKIIVNNLKSIMQSSDISANQREHIRISLLKSMISF